MLDCIHVLFFSSWKTVLKSWLDTSSIPCYLSSFSSIFLKRNLDTSSTSGGSIELLFLNLILCCLIPTRYLSCWQPVPQHLPRQLPQYLSIPQLSSITEGSIYFSIAILLSFLRSLSICSRLFISQTLSFSLQTFSSRILQAFSSFSLLGKLLILSHSCISCFET